MVDPEEAKDLADSIGAPLFFTSARLGTGIPELFDSVVKRLIIDAKKTSDEPAPPPGNSVDIRNIPPGKSGCC